MDVRSGRTRFQSELRVCEKIEIRPTSSAVQTAIIQNLWLSRLATPDKALVYSIDKM